MIIDYEEGDLVRVIAGDMEGHTGEIDRYEDAFDLWMVNINGLPFGKNFEEIQPVWDTLDEEEEEEDEPPPFGMSSQDLASYVETYAQRCSSRIKGIGDAQYNQGNYQRFETMTPGELLQNLQEELEDLVPYIAMLHIVTQRMEKALREAAIE